MYAFKSMMLILLLSIALITGCQSSMVSEHQSTPSSIVVSAANPTSTSTPSPAPAETDIKWIPGHHVPMNEMLMSKERRSQLRPVDRELLGILDDLIYDFNHHVPLQKHFSSTDIPTNFHFGEGYLVIQATDQFKIIHNGAQFSMVGFHIEIRKSKDSKEIIWQDDQGGFGFVVNSSQTGWFLGYWSS